MEGRERKGGGGKGKEREAGREGEGTKGDSASSPHEMFARCPCETVRYNDLSPSRFYFVASIFYVL